MKITKQQLQRVIREATYRQYRAKLGIERDRRKYIANMRDLIKKMTLAIDKLELDHSDEISIEKLEDSNVYLNRLIEMFKNIEAQY